MFDVIKILVGNTNNQLIQVKKPWRHGCVDTKTVYLYLDSKLNKSVGLIWGGQKRKWQICINKIKGCNYKIWPVLRSTSDNASSWGVSAPSTATQVRLFDDFLTAILLLLDASSNSFSLNDQTPWVCPIKHFFFFPGREEAQQLSRLATLPCLENLCSHRVLKWSHKPALPLCQK